MCMFTYIYGPQEGYANENPTIYNNIMNNKYMRIDIKLKAWHCAA